MRRTTVSLAAACRIREARGQVGGGATERGLAQSPDGGRRWQPVRGPAGLLLDRERRDALWAISDYGQLWDSNDAGASWKARGRINSQPEASWPTRRGCTRPPERPSILPVMVCGNGPSPGRPES
jgi:photosystem II stability/assembly factor-like uncharacterized protein